MVSNYIHYLGVREVNNTLLLVGDQQEPLELCNILIFLFDPLYVVID